MSITLLLNGSTSHTVFSWGEWVVRSNSAQGLLSQYFGITPAVIKCSAGDQTPNDKM